MDPRPWSVAWQDALYAAGRGFYVTRGGPSAHFTTAAHSPTGPVLADAMLRLWHRSHDEPPEVIVDVGAGRGELTTHLLHATAPPTLTESTPPVPEPAPRLVAVDVVERPDDLDSRVEWVRSPGGAALPAGLGPLEHALVIAHEWLDVVPCTIAEVDDEGVLREVLVAADGAESLGGRVEGADRQWAEKHWPTRDPGDRVEIGRTRDHAWADLLARVRSGLVVAVDYGHTLAERPREGTLTAYGRGRRVDPVPDGTCDLTAHVAIDTLAKAEVHRQRNLLRDLAVRGETPDVAAAATDPRGYLASLERAAAESQLIARGGFGDFWWAVRHV